MLEIDIVELIEMIETIIMIKMTEMFKTGKILVLPLDIQFIRCATKLTRTRVDRQTSDEILSIHHLTFISVLSVSV